MRVGNFSVQVPEAKERDSGHAVLGHGSVYTLRLGNHCYDKRCDASVVIDGKDMGAYRINAGQTVVLERSSDDRGKFTFFEAVSSEAQAAGVTNIREVERGLITVVFKVERKREREEKTGGGILRSLSSNSPYKGRGPTGQSMGGFSPASVEACSAGITGLTGHSDQNFVEVSNLDYDHAETTTINLRLVCDKAVREMRPVTPKNNPVPAAV